MSAPVSEEALREAAAWMTRLKVAQGREAEQREFASWLTRSPVNVRHYLELVNLDAQLQDKTLFANLDELCLKPGDNVVQWSAAPTQPPLQRKAKSWGARGIAAAAALVIIVVVGVTSSLPRLQDQRRYLSGRGELRSIALPDGSIVTLNTQSDIRLRYSSGARTVELLSGEALFRVAKRANLPFRVLVGDSVVQAIGTEFNIDRSAERPLVTVVEGRVSIHPSSASQQENSPVLLSAGEQLSVAPGAQVRRLAPIQISRVTTWTQRRLVFDQAPVSEVVRQLNRYNKAQLSVTDTALARRSVTGTFESSDPDSFVQFLEQQGGVSVRVRQDRSLVLLGSAQGGEVARHPRL